MGQEYNPGKKMTKAKNLKMSATKDDKGAEKHTDEPQPSKPPTAPEADLGMPPLEDIDTPQKKFRFKNPDQNISRKNEHMFSCKILNFFFPNYIFYFLFSGIKVFSGDSSH